MGSGGDHEDDSDDRDDDGGGADGHNDDDDVDDNDEEEEEEEEHGVGGAGDSVMFNDSMFILRDLLFSVRGLYYETHNRILQMLQVLQG